jgi:hypothetical protein
MLGDGREKGGTLLGGEPQGGGKLLQRTRLGALPLAALQRPDTLLAQACAPGQDLLRKACGLAIAP